MLMSHISADKDDGAGSEEDQSFGPLLSSRKTELYTEKGGRGWGGWG